MKRMTLTLLAGLWFAFLPLVALADAPTCEVCSMKVDVAHHVHFKYRLEGGREVQIGSLTCAEKYWSEHRSEHLVFLASDYVTGKFTPADAGVFLVGSKLKGGTGMDRGGALFFADRAAAEEARRKNGGRVVSLEEALSAVKR